MEENTRYYIRAYAINEKGVGYGGTVEFTTLKKGIPRLSDVRTSELSFASVKLSSSVINNGNLDVTARGFCWSTSPNPTVENNRLQVGNGMGEFTETVSGLQEDTKYYIRSYATNETGTGYSNELVVTTGKRSVPILKPTIIGDIGDTFVSLSSDIESSGYLDITEFGFCMSTSPNPTIADSKVTCTSGFAEDVYGLQGNTKYYVRSYAMNQMGVGYGEENSFFTQPTVVITDQFFEKFCLYKFDTNKDGKLTYSETKNVIKIDFSDYHDFIRNTYGDVDPVNYIIRSLEGIEYFNALQYLEVDANLIKIRSFDTSICPNLKQLILPCGTLQSLNISNCAHLETLECAYTQLTSLDISGCANLKKLNCRDNGQLSALKVNNHANLTELSLSYNPLSSIDVSNCPNLKSLDCGGNQLTSLDGIGNCPNLTGLNCRDNQLTSLDGIGNCPNLTGLDCGGNQLTSLDGIGNCPNLTGLNCDGNQLTSLDVSGCSNLTNLSCGYNRLTVLDVSKNTSLTNLYCWGNQLTTMDVSNNRNLTNLNCERNRLTSLDVNGCTSLTMMICSDNRLTSLDVNGCISLKMMICSDNQLTSLDVSKNTNLGDLECHSNSLTSLDVSTNLGSLYCSYNQLTSLDVSECTRLSYLQCQDNSNLQYLYLKSGQIIKYFYKDAHTQIVYK